MFTYLKVKIKTLAAEAKIIRSEEIKAKSKRNTDLVQGLTIHRKVIVGKEARSSYLAYGFLRGVPYEKIESHCRWDNQPDWAAVEKMALRFGVDDNRVVKQKFAEWKPNKDSKGQLTEEQIAKAS